MGAISFSLDEALLQFFLSELPLSAFFETGTFRGDTVEMARRHFKECHSAELSPELHAQAEARFRGVPGVTIHLGESPALLARFRAQFASEPSFIWLDAHWCSAEAAAGINSQSPLLREIEAIGKLHPDAVLMIDDARLYLCPPGGPHTFTDWPDFHDITLALLRLEPAHRLAVYNDVIVFYPGRLREAFTRYMNKTAADWLSIRQQSEKYRQRKERWRRWTHPFSR